MIQRARVQPEDDGINIAPMLDVVFILLIFFIVTTSFVRESGLDVSRPSAQQPQTSDDESNNVLVKIDELDQVFVDGRALSGLKSIKPSLQLMLAEKPEMQVIVAAHSSSHTETLIHVVDAARSLGIGAVSVAKQH